MYNYEDELVGKVDNNISVDWCLQFLTSWLTIKYFSGYARTAIGTMSNDTN